MRLSVIPRVLALLTVLAPAPALPNDGAAVVAAGGIQLRNERRVAMRKERLFVGLDMVRVEYEFVNESKVDVTTEVAFPVPEFGYSPVYGPAPRFDDFRAWVGDEEIAVGTEARAFAGGRDVTKRLEGLGIDVVSFGRSEVIQRKTSGGAVMEDSPEGQIPRLPEVTIQQLCAEGIVCRPPPDDLWFPGWKVRITKHWTQRFPPGEIVRIRHEYRPAAGETNALAFLDESCAHPDFRKEARAGTGLVRIIPRWVEYILTTANTWKTPIRDFELVVEHDEGVTASFCWDGKVDRTGPRTLRAAAKDFVPKRELTVYFFRGYR